MPCTSPRSSMRVASAPGGGIPPFGAQAKVLCRLSVRPATWKASSAACQACSPVCMSTMIAAPS
eukprot:12848667-Prorocentrum_lima.AAC.1